MIISRIKFVYLSSFLFFSSLGLGFNLHAMKDSHEEHLRRTTSPKAQKRERKEVNHEETITPASKIKSIYAIHATYKLPEDGIMIPGKASKRKDPSLKLEKG